LAFIRSAVTVSKATLRASLNLHSSKEQTFPKVRKWHNL